MPIKVEIKCFGYFQFIEGIIFGGIYFLHGLLHISFRKIITDKILHTILNSYRHISFVNKLLSLFRNFVWDATYHKSFGLILITVNEILKHVFLYLTIELFPYSNIYTIYCRWCWSSNPVKFQYSFKFPFTIIFSNPIKFPLCKSPYFL